MQDQPQVSITTFNTAVYSYVVIINVFTGDVDFNDNPLRITIPAGKTTVNFTVPIIVDNVIEGTETFKMRLIATAARCLEVGPQRTAIGEIRDEGK